MCVCECVCVCACVPVLVLVGIPDESVCDDNRISEEIKVSM